MGGSAITLTVVKFLGRKTLRTTGARWRIQLCHRYRHFLTEQINFQLCERCLMSVHNPHTYKRTLNAKQRCWNRPNRSKILLIFVSGDLLQFLLRFRTHRFWFLGLHDSTLAFPRWPSRSRLPSRRWRLQSPRQQRQAHGRCPRRSKCIAQTHHASDCSNENEKPFWKSGNVANSFSLMVGALGNNLCGGVYWL